jgi:hypothetical protein
VLDAGFPLSARVELTVLDRGAPADGRAAELRESLWAQLALVLRYRAAEGAAEASRSQVSGTRDAAEASRRVSGTRERLVARIREVEEEQQQLLAALRVGADGFSQITRVDRDPAARGRGKTAGPALLPPVEVILGAR